jgi:hypothetical protein
VEKVRLIVCSIMGDREEYGRLAIKWINKEQGLRKEIPLS